MAKFGIVSPLILAVVLASAQVAMAETRAEMAVHPAGDTRVADLPAGHWATNATQVVIANNVLTLDDGAFHGDRLLTPTELNKAMDALASTAETIASKGSNARLRAALGNSATGAGPITRLELSQTLANFLDACASEKLVAIAAANNDATRFKDIGAAVSPSVKTVVDKYKVMTGYPDNTFHPNTPVTRYQMAAIAFNVLNTMKTAPLAQLPVAAPVAAAPIIVVVPGPTIIEKPAVVVAAGPTERENFRARSPFHLDYQAVNSTNLSGGNPFAIIPLEGQITAYQGPVMLQNQTNLRVNAFQDNNVDSEFRVGYSGLKYGIVQLIPYVGAHLGLGTSAPAGGTQYDTYIGATYGTILSVMPTDAIDLHAQFGQTALMAAGRFNSSFQPTNYPNALGSVLSAYGLGADFYVAPNMCLSLGIDTWQDPAALRTGNQTNASGVINTFGGSVGIGSSF